MQVNKEIIEKALLHLQDHQTNVEHLLSETYTPEGLKKELSEIEEVLQHLQEILDS